MSILYQTLQNQLQQRKSTHLFRSLKTCTDRKGAIVDSNGRSLINFCSNNYLDLADHPLLKKRAQEYIDTYGVGTTASRLICGTYSYHEALEEKIASLTGKEAAVLFNSGYQANITVLPALLDHSANVLLDKLCHNSLLMGAKLSGASMFRYRHNDMNHLKTILQRVSSSVKPTLIVTESVFSMDGDCANLDGIAKLAKQYDAALYVDEAHAFGIMGKKGMGLTADREDVDFVLGGLGKGAGCFGAFLGCSRMVKEYLTNYCSGFIYSTAPPPAVVGAIDAAMDLIPTLDHKRKQLGENAHYLQMALGLALKSTASPIIPLVVGDDEKVLQYSARLEENGFLVQPIRPPTVLPGTSRLRITVTSEHTQDQMDKLVSLL